MPSDPRTDALAPDSDQSTSDSRNGVPNQPAPAVEAGRGESLQIRRDEISVSYSGPLPPPNMLAGYEQTLEGSAERIVRQAEVASERRHRLEETLVNANVRLAARGQVFAFVIAMTGLVGGIVLAALGEPIPGAASAIIAVGVVAGMFVSTRRKDGREPPGKQSVGQGSVLSEQHHQETEPPPLAKPNGNGSG